MPEAIRAAGGRKGGILMPVAVSAPKRAQYEDLFDVPDHMVGEIVNGKLFASPRRAVPQSLAASTLGIDLGSAFQRGRGGPGGWWNATVLVPDLAGWRKERMAVPPQAAAMAIAGLPPIGCARFYHRQRRR